MTSPLRSDGSEIPGLFDLPVGDMPLDEPYRPVSRWAVVALILGALAPLALFGPGLWFLPVAGAGAAALALGSLSRPDPPLLGRKAALAGLVLSAAFGAAAATSWLASWRLSERHAVAVAEAWVGLVRDGRLLEARAMLAPEAMPLAAMSLAGADDDLAKPIDDVASREAGMRAVPVVAAIMGCIGAASPAGSFQAFIPESTEQNEAWQVRVVLGPCDGQDPLTLLVGLKRSMQPDEATWTGWAENWAIKTVQPGG